MTDADIKREAEKLADTCTGGRVWTRNELTAAITALCIRVRDEQPKPPAQCEDINCYDDSPHNKH